jgi:hypothetical protein
MISANLRVRAVAAGIADYNQHFLVTIAVLQVLKSDGNRIAQCYLTMGSDSGQDNFQLEPFGL